MVDGLAKRPYNYYIDNKEPTVGYTLITKQGKVMTFYVKSVADLYQSLHGGVVITQQILVDELAKA